MLSATVNIILTPEDTGADAGAPTGVPRMVILGAAQQAGRKRRGRGGRRMGVVRDRVVTRSMTKAAREAAGQTVVVLIDDRFIKRSEFVDMTGM